MWRSGGGAALSVARGCVGECREVQRSTSNLCADLFEKVAIYFSNYFIILSL